MSSQAELDWLALASTSDPRGFYEEIGVPLPASTAADVSVRCFADPEAHAHDDKNRSCHVSTVTGLWKCHGCGAGGNAYKAAQALGYDDGAAAVVAKRYGLFVERVKAPKRPEARMPTELKLAKWRHAMRDHTKLQERLAEVRGWHPMAIQRLGLGWDGERIVFPVRNQKRKVTGIVRYLPGGKPKSIATGKRDLFPAPESIHPRHPLFIVEGETDVVAVWSAGYRAVGVPGAASWRKEWAYRLMGRTLVILSDCDAPGRALGQRIANETNGRWVDIEPGREDHYDIGDMVREAHADDGLWQVHELLGALIP